MEKHMDIWLTEPVGEPKSSISFLLAQSHLVKNSTFIYLFIALFIYLFISLEPSPPESGKQAGALQFSRGSCDL